MIEIAGGRGNNNDTFNSTSVGQQSGARSNHGTASHASSVDLHAEKKMEDMKVAYEKKVDELKRQVEDSKRQVEDLKKQLESKASYEMATRSSIFWLALFSALLQILNVVRSQVLTPLPQKTNVIRIGTSFPYANPYAMGDVAAMTNHLSDNLGSIMIYNFAKRYVEMINADPNILPTTRLELVPMNSGNDRGRALMTTLDLIQQYNVSGVIGEMYSRNTVTMAVAAAVNNVLHCVPASIAPSLSNKADFPTTFRTQVANAYQARALIGLMQYWNRTTFGVIASNDEAGNGFVTEITSFATEANITLTKAVFADVGAQDYSEWLNILIRNRVQNIVMYVPAADGAIAFTSARKLGMFDGSYWFMVTSGITPDFFNTEQTVPTLTKMRGTWQVDDIFISDAVNTGKNTDAFNLAR
ncbi:hypothetical protein HDV05_008307, partial [Chytridiales sp. JEL 0842]